MKNYYWLFLALLSLNSCKDETAETESSTKLEEAELDDFNIKALYSTNHTISREEAEKLALAFVNQSDEDGKCLKSSKVTIANSVVRVTKGLKTSNVNSQDTLGYFVNFAGDNGYAYICADDRINNGIFAVFDHGNYEGNESVDSLIAPVYSMMDNYVSSSVKEFERKKKQRLAMVEEAIRCGKLDTSSKNGLKCTFHFIQLAPLLKTELSQDGVWKSLLDNCKCPFCVNNNKTQKVVPGCVTVALTQLMVFWEKGWMSKYATSSTITNKYIDFDKILLEENSSNKTVNLARREAKAEAVRYFYNQIREYNGILRDYNGKLSTDHNLTRMNSDVIRNIDIARNYNVSNKEPFDVEKVHKWISDKRLPLFIEGDYVEIEDDGSEWPDENRNHMWLIDGYKYVVNLPNKVKLMFHHNWGWGGKHNGWFNANLFIQTETYKGYVAGYKNLKTWSMIHKDWESGRKPAHSAENY